MNNKLLSALLLLLCTVSCRKEPLPEYSGTPVVFTDSKVETKTAGIITSDNLTSMGIFAYYTQLNDFNPNSGNGDIPNYMYGQQVIKNAATQTTPSNWSYTPLKYWPANTDEKISFFGFAPCPKATPEDLASKDSIALCANTNKGLPYIDFTVKQKPADQIDFLMAVPVLNQHPTSDTIPFQFRHTLAMVRFSFQSLNMKSISVGGAYGKGRIGYDSNYNLTWSNLGYSSDFNIDSTKFTIDPKNFIGSSNESGTLMMIPQENTEITLTLTYETITEPIKRVEGETVNREITWEMGKRYLYNISIKDNKLVITLKVGKISDTGEPYDDDWEDVSFEEETIGG